ncbi:hypothetical protein [Yinghuangia seranimata]|uniref:hypothetical protein n=1 Tax=Yinghuangia seranimata TaxID=408067 RepID=UPI00248AD6ED|nr:hypothetical protein [Yinghuangia seranimata]MDI2129029.1 hypothetical protein [Yinghuangia seranimata]
MTKTRTAPNRHLLDRVAEDYEGEPDVVFGTMFASPGLRTGGKIFAFLGHKGELIVKLPREQVERLVEAGTAEQVTMGTRTMREWIGVPPQDNDAETLELWRKVAADAYEYVDGLREKD